MKDTAGNSWEFYKSTGKLYKIKDRIGNSCQVNYSSGRISSITDGAGKPITFAYNASNRLSSITEPGNRIYSFSYDGLGSLYKITYPDLLESTYTNCPVTYRLLTATNHDGYKVEYSYTTPANNYQPYRVNLIRESNTDGSLGQTLNITYKHNETDFTDLYGKIVTSQFNYYGNTISVKDHEGNAGYATYDSSSGTHRNWLTMDSKVQKTVVNRLLNHSMEQSDAYSVGNWSGSTGTGGYTTAQKHTGLRSIYLEKTNTSGTLWQLQTLTVEKGKTYTLSGYVKTSGITSTSGKGALLLARYNDSYGNQPIVKSEYINGTISSWQRLEVTFSIPIDSTSETVYIRAGIEGETGTAYFDNLQLEEGEFASRLNLLENPDFKYLTGEAPTYWSKNSHCDSSDLAVAYSYYPNPADLDTNRFRIYGKTDKTKQLLRMVELTGNTSGTTKDVFVVSGWAKANSAPLNYDSGRSFALKVGIYYDSGQVVWKSVPFNPDVRTWQFASGQVIADLGSYYRVAVIIEYKNNVNTAYFDGLALYRE